ncbi:MAG: MerR family transcriptional regulator [bacterium]|nr:MerR family transcriptional regulator [bacterium]
MKIIGISYRQIQYWDKSNFVKPSHRRRGKYRQYTRMDLLRMKVAKILRDSGYSIQALRDTTLRLRGMLSEITMPLESITIFVDKENIFISDGPVLTAGCHGYAEICARDLWHNVAVLYE